MTSKLPRGISNANPGNIEWGDPWQGLLPVNKRTDPRFCQFTSAAWGIRAMARTLIVYQDKHQKRTIKDILNRWAPPVENNTQAYIDQVARNTGRGATELLDLHTYADLRPLVEAIILHENGRGPKGTMNTWYDEDTINEGLRLAGVKPEPAIAAKVPVTKETVGATATGGVGVVQIADALPQVTEAITQADGHLSSGSVVRVVIGVVLVGIAVFIAYSQVKRYKSGQL